jgi:hypothetical protein
MIVPMPARELPVDLVQALHRARELEHGAVGIGQRRRAIQGTADLLLAAVSQGWHAAELGREIGIEAKAAQKRVAAARERYGDSRPALAVPEPPKRPKALDILKTPIEDREWLSLPEASAYTGRSCETIKKWRRLGLLPNTHTVTPTWKLYLRADLKRVMRAPEYKRGGVNRKALLRLLSTAVV